MDQTNQQVSKSRRHSSMNNEQKRELILYHQKHPKLSQASLRDYFNKKFNIIIGRSTIYDLLKPERMNRILNDTNLFRQRDRSSMHPKLEDALNVWFTDASSKQLHVTNELLILKAQEIGTSLNIKDFKYSNGWLDRFKKRYGISLRSNTNKKPKEVSGNQETSSTQSSAASGLDENDLSHQLVPNENSPTLSVNNESLANSWVKESIGSAESDTNTRDGSVDTNQVGMFNEITVKDEKLEFDDGYLKVTSDDAMNSFNILVSFFEQNRRCDDNFAILSKIRSKLDEIIDHQAKI